MKIAILLLAGTGTPESLGRAVNALVSAKEFKDANDEITIILDGAGTQWVGELSKPEHQYHKLFAEVKGSIAGVCEYCANAYGVANSIRSAGIPMLDEFHGHPSIRKLLQDGFQILTF